MAEEQDKNENNFNKNLTINNLNFEKVKIGKKLEISKNIKKLDHLNRPKSRKELIQIAASVLGIEFAYAAETGFVSPILLSLGVGHTVMSLVWCLSPIIGFFVTPILGSLSDGYRSKYGKRRPFIFLFSVGIVIGLLLVPSGKYLGIFFGDSCQENLYLIAESENKTVDEEFNYSSHHGVHCHPLGLVLTIIGFLFLDLNADACQSPARTYLIEITVPDDHAKGLSTFTILAGLGGTLGYLIGFVNWEELWIGQLIGQIGSVFSMIVIIFIISVWVTLTSFAEIPTNKNSKELKTIDEISSNESCSEILEEKMSSVEYLKSIVNIPTPIMFLCLTNLFSWMSQLCYVLYFTDFVGEVVYNGSPRDDPESDLRKDYEDGVRFGCLGLCVDSLACSIYSFYIDRLIARFGAKSIYIFGHISKFFAMIFLAYFPNPIMVLISSSVSGIMYATLFTMPYLFISRYQETKAFENLKNSKNRGLGTDFSIVTSMMFLAQIIQAITLGNLVTIFESSTTTIWLSAIFALFGTVSAFKVLYI